LHPPSTAGLSTSLRLPRANGSVPEVGFHRLPPAPPAPPRKSESGCAPDISAARTLYRVAIDLPQCQGSPDSGTHTPADWHWGNREPAQRRPPPAVSAGSPLQPPHPELDCRSPAATAASSTRRSAPPHWALRGASPSRADRPSALQATLDSGNSMLERPLLSSGAPVRSRSAAINSVTIKNVTGSSSDKGRESKHRGISSLRLGLHHPPYRKHFRESRPLVRIELVRGRNADSHW